MASHSSLQPSPLPGRPLSNHTLPPARASQASQQTPRRERERERQEGIEGWNISNGTAVPAVVWFSLSLEPYVASFPDFLSVTMRRYFGSLEGCGACIKAVSFGCFNNSLEVNAYDLTWVSGVGMTRLVWFGRFWGQSVGTCGKSFKT